MKYVLDSSVAVKWVLLEQFSDKAKRLRADFQTHVHELVSPDFFPLEVLHALTRAERQGRISPPQGGILWADVMTTPPRLVPSLPLAPRAYEISSQMRVGVHDCVYVALAETEQCDLITADDKLIKNLQIHFPFIQPLAGLP
jgi:predicted nucleic acid-binding protein